jgi:predicted transcriptional regulator
MSVLEDYDRMLRKFMPAFKSSAANMMTKECGMTQQQAAALLGVTQAAISKYIKDGKKRYPGVKIDQKAVREFVAMLEAKDIKGSKKLMCKMCQDHVQFDCALVKQ